MRHTRCVRSAVVFTLALACSCTAAQSRRAHTGGAVALAGGLFGILGAITLAEVVPSTSHTATSVGVVFVPISVLGALAYIATDSAVNDADREQAQTAAERSYSAAYELAREAKHAARRGDCAEVQAIEPRVREMNERVYRKFLHDDIIRTCLGPQPTPTVSPEPDQ